MPESFSRKAVQVSLTILVFAAAFFSVRYVTDQYLSKTDTEEIAQYLQDDPKTAELFGTLQQYFPEDYAAFLGKLEEVMNTDPPEGKVKESAYFFMQDFTKTHMSNVFDAPSDKLAAVISSQKEFIIQLQAENTKQCADFGMRGLDQHTALSDASLSLLIGVVKSQIIAAHFGITTPSPKREITEDDSASLVKNMLEAGAPPELVKKMVFGEGDGQPTLDEECLFSVSLFKALDMLPEDVRGSVFSSMLSGAME